MNVEKQAKNFMKSAKSNFAKAKRKYVCRSLKDLIKAYRACTTRSEERALVKKEAAHIRDLFREGDKAFRRQNIAKLLFFHMNGYPTDFGMTECIKLCASNKYNDKRVAYLGLMILVDETEEILMLMTNSLKQDLNSGDLHITSLALNVLGDIASEEMVRDLLPEIEKHLLSVNPYIRKKAALAAVRAVKKLSVDETLSIARDVPALFDVKSPAVHISGAALVSALCRQSRANIADLQVAMTPVLVHIMRDHLLGGNRGNSETIVSGIKNPFLQVKLMSAIRLLLQSGASQNMLADVWDVLAQVAANTDSAKVAGCAVLYECVRTITAIPAERSLRELAVNILGKFLAHKEPTVRYIALQELTRVVDTDGPGALRTIDEPKKKILAGLHEVDPTVRKRAAELIFKIAVKENVEEIVKELLRYIDASESAEAVEDGCWKVFMLLDRLGPSDEWKIETFVKALSSADVGMPEELIASFIALVSARPNVQPHAVLTLFNETLRKGSTVQLDNNADVFDGKSASTNGGKAGDKSAPVKRKPRLERVALYILGEHGEASTQVGLEVPEILDAFERVLNASEQKDEEWMNTFESTFQNENRILREVALTGLVKFASRTIGGSLSAPLTQGLDDSILAITSGGESTKNVGSSILALPPAPSTTSGVQDQGIGTDLLASMGLGEEKPKAIENGGIKALVPASSSLVPSHGAGTSGALMSLESDASSGSGNPVLDRVRRILLARVRDPDLEIQQRACEYLMLLHDSLGSVLSSTLAPMPPLDYEKIQERAKRRKEMRTTSQSATQPGGSGLLLDLMGDVGAEESHPQALPPAGSNLLALPSTSTTVPAADDFNLDDLIGGSASQSEHASTSAQGQMPDLAMLALESNVTESRIEESRTTIPEVNLGMGMTEDGEASRSGAVLSTILFESVAVKVDADFFKDDSSNPGLIRAELVFSNKLETVMKEFVFLLAVPKYIRLQMHAASAGEIEAGGTATQRVELENSMVGEKPIQLRYRVQWEGNVEQGVATGLESL